MRRRSPTALAAADRAPCTCLESVCCACPTAATGHAGWLLRCAAHSPPSILLHSACQFRSPTAQGGQEENLMYAAAVGHAALGALCLWRGLAEDEK